MSYITPNDISYIPNQPGIYKYFDSNHNLLYVGKAKNLKKRVSSYFNREDLPTKTKLLVKKINSIEYTIVTNEKDALLLENSLIKTHQPKYNISLKDDKTYPYIKIANELFPRIYFTRKKISDGGKYFGPYTSVHNVRYILESIKKIFPLRTCSLQLTLENIQQQKFKPCLEYHIKNCNAPCIAKQSKESYDDMVSQITDILNGKTALVRQQILAEIQVYANKLEFEHAAHLKHKLDTLSEYLSHSTVCNLDIKECHVLGYTEDETLSVINYLFIYDGNIIKTRTITINKRVEETKEYLLQNALAEVIINWQQQQHVIIPFEIDIAIDTLKCIIPKIGEKKKVLDLAQKNAITYLHKLRMKGNATPSDAILKIMQQELRLTELPIHIECFDNSNIQGTNPVAACVVFKQGKPSKKDYRHFHIKTVEGPNDFDSMKEIVFRRYSRLLEEHQALPQLVVIDGGKGQLNAALESIDKLGLRQQIQLISIAKRLEEIYYPNDNIPLHLHKKSETLRVLQHLRDEAHRFGITFHRNTRSKKFIQTELQQISGIGEKIAEKLLQYFGSVSSLQQANESDIAKLVGKHKAAIIVNYFSSKNNN